MSGTLAPHLLRQFRVLGFGFFQDGNIRVGIFPQREEILVGSAGAGTVAGEARARPNCRWDSEHSGAVRQSPRWSRIFWNSAAASGP